MKFPREEHEIMPDPLDQAAAAERRNSEIALNDVRRACRRSQEPDESGAYAILECVWCGEEIGKGRLDAAIKNTLCIYCATAQERLK